MRSLARNQQLRDYTLSETGGRLAPSISGSGMGRLRGTTVSKMGVGPPIALPWHTKWHILPSIYRISLC